MKSLIVSVFWPAWEWGPAGLPFHRFYTTSFKDELVTRAELMRRNSMHRHGPELARITQLRGCITRQINRRTRAQESTT